MLKNYFIVAIRSLFSNKLISAINIFGLAIGLVCCILILLFTHYEFSYDKYHKDAEQIYRVERDFINRDGSLSLSVASAAPPVAPLLKESFSEVEDYTRIARTQLPVTRDDIRIIVENVGLVDDNLFDFFHFEFLSGDHASALRNPSSIVISSTVSKRLFGNVDAMGKNILLSGEHLLTVSGVFEDLPNNTHLKLDVLAHIQLVEKLFGEGQLENWGNNSFFTYIKINDPSSHAAQLESKLPNFLNRHIMPTAHEWTALNLRKLTDIHLYSNKQNELSNNGSFKVVLTFLFIALFVLLIAGVNFMNLSTAKSIQRAKEIGVRKTMGAKKHQLVLQFLCESIIITAIAMIVALVFVSWVHSDFSQFVKRDIQLSTLFSLNSVALIVIATIVVGVLAGSYPAFYLSKFKVAEVLKGKTRGSITTSIIQKGFLIIQFAVSTCLLIATAVVFSQLDYVKNKDPGYDHSNELVVTLPNSVPLWSNYMPLKRQLLANPLIESVTLSNQVPTGHLLDGSGYFSADQGFSREMMKNLRDVKVDYDFFEQYKLGLLAGRFFSEDFNDREEVNPTEKEPHGRGNMIINESAMALFGFKSPREAIGKELISPRAAKLKSTVRYTIVGVIEDFHFSSLHFAISPIAFTAFNPDVQRFISIKYKPNADGSVVQLVDSAWKKLNPNIALSYEFMDDKYERMYRDNTGQARLLMIFSLLGITIAVIGLYGMASFTTELRSKEIAIRKVLGARAVNILMMLNKESAILIIIANIIAWPLAYWIVKWRLSQFAYSIDISLLVFIAATVFVLAVSWLIISAQAIKIAIGRPVKALRYE